MIILVEFQTLQYFSQISIPIYTKITITFFVSHIIFLPFPFCHFNHPFTISVSGFPFLTEQLPISDYLWINSKFFSLIFKSIHDLDPMSFSKFIHYSSITCNLNPTNFKCWLSSNHTMKLCNLPILLHLLFHVLPANITIPWKKLKHYLGLYILHHLGVFFPPLIPHT